MTKFEEGQQIIILHNPSQPWTEGKIGRVARVETQKFSPLPSLQGILPWYYVLVDEHSNFSSGCVLTESQILAWEQCRLDFDPMELATEEQIAREA